MAADGGTAGTLAEMGEFELIAQITPGLEVAAGAVEVGTGDDCAVVKFAGSVAVSTDTMVEGTHFRRNWSTAPEIGAKAVAAAVADLEAVAAKPTAMVVSFAAPPDLPANWAKQCAQGMRLEAEKSGIALVGGDITSSEAITITVTVLGDVTKPVLRSGARAGQVIAIKGRLGWAAAGLKVLSRGFRSPRAVVEAQKVPEVPYGAGREAAAAGATAMIDISDGLLADLGHIAEASGVLIDIDTSALELPEPIQAVAAATGTDPYQFVLAGGEDHALAAAFAPDAVPEGWLVVGSVSEGEAGVLVDGKTWEGSEGYDHFRK